MRKNFSITPVAGNKNEVNITFLKDFSLEVDKKDDLFIKFLAMVLDRSGARAAYFAPLLGLTKQAFHNLKKKVKAENIKSLFLAELERQKPKELPDSDIGKIIELMVKNPKDSEEEIAAKFNRGSTSKIDFKSVEKIRQRFGLKIT